MPINAVEEGKLLVLKAARVNRGARNLIREGGDAKMVEECSREMGRIAAEHSLLVLRFETKHRHSLR